MNVSESTGKLLDSIFLGTECKNSWYNLFSMNNLKTGIRLENSLLDKGLMMTNFIPGGFSGISNYKGDLDEENTNDMFISWMDKGKLEKLTYLYYFMPWSIKSLKKNESLYLDLVDPLYKLLMSNESMKERLLSVPKMPFTVAKNITKNMTGLCSHFKVGVSSDIVDFVIGSFNEANHNFPMFTKKMSMREIHLKDDYFAGKDAIYGDIKLSLKKSGKYTIFRNLFDSAYMLEYILMNIGQKSLRNLLESLVVSNKELSVLKSISDILAETLGLKLTYDDSLGKYTIRESLYNSKISIKPELAALMSSMSKGNLDTETEYIKIY